MKGRTKLRGIERADSVALDPHKTLFLPYGTGAALVRDGNQLLHAFSATADYIQPLGESEVGPSPADLSPGADAPFPGAPALVAPADGRGRGVSSGAAGEAAAGAIFPRAGLSQLPDFDAGPPPDLSVVAFRYRPEGMDADFASERLLQHLQQEGRVMLSGTRIDGKYFIRCAILSFRSHAEHVDDAIDAIVRAARTVKS